MGSGFSYESLQQQLTSSSGDGFSTADAKFAINYLQPDWHQQAVDAAQGYLQMGSGFSYESLLQQLTSALAPGSQRLTPSSRSTPSTRTETGRPSMPPRVTCRWAGSAGPA